MVSEVEQNAQPRPQMLFVGAEGSKRLLEVYVKRSLSLNDGSHCPSRRGCRTRKWDTAAERNKRERKHSSDTSLHLKPSDSEEDLGEDEAFSEPENDRKAQVPSETTDNRSNQLKKKTTPSRNDVSSVSLTSDGKAQKGSSHSDKNEHHGRQPDIPSFDPKHSASEEDLSKDKEFSGPVTEIETSDKCTGWKKSPITKRDSSSAPHNSDGKQRKWFLPFDKDKRDSRLSSNEASKVEIEDLKIEDHLLAVESQLESLTDVKKTKEGKKTKKPSLWKSVLGWFSRGNTDKQDEPDDDGKTQETPSTPEATTTPFSCLPISTGEGTILRHPKFARRRRSQRRLSLRRHCKDMGLDKTTVWPLTLDLPTEAHNYPVKSIEAVEASYYEKMSEELKKIVNEVKNSPTEENKTFTDSVQPADTDARSQEEIIKRIIDLIKKDGDLINDKLKENTTISSYFNTITYGAFQLLADQYVNSEVPQQTQPPMVAPEMVKFAFTLDFTARMAALSRHAPGHILGFGNQYLKERFTYMCENHPYISDITTDKQNALKESSDRDKGFGDHAEGIIS